jgi:hypothetical protein
MVSTSDAVVLFTGLQTQTLPLKEYCAPLNKALLLNLMHQQQKIRVAALHAIGALVPVDPAILKDTLPSVAKLNLDRTHQLREQVSASIRCPRCCSQRYLCMVPLRRSWAVDLCENRAGASCNGSVAQQA